MNRRARFECMFLYVEMNSIFVFCFGFGIALLSSSDDDEFKPTSSKGVNETVEERYKNRSRRKVKLTEKAKASGILVLVLNYFV